MADLADSIQLYYESFSELTKAIREKFTVGLRETLREEDKEVIKTILQSRGILGRIKRDKSRVTPEGKFVKSERRSHGLYVSLL